MKIPFVLLVVMLIVSSHVYAADAEYLLNHAELTPTTTGIQQCDQIVSSTLAQITNGQMTTYDKVKACYDYLIATCSYGHNQLSYNIPNGDFTNLTKLEGPMRAFGMLRNHVGVCDDYTCAFTALVRAIGLNCYTIGGLTAKANGGMTGHAWCVINVGGTEYVFDPQIDDNIAKGGPVGYYRFCKTYDEIPGAYDAGRKTFYFRPLFEGESVWSEDEVIPIGARPEPVQIGAAASIRKK